MQRATLGGPKGIRARRAARARSYADARSQRATSYQARGRANSHAAYARATIAGSVRRGRRTRASPVRWQTKRLARALIRRGATAPYSTSSNTSVRRPSKAVNAVYAARRSRVSGVSPTTISETNPIIPTRRVRWCLCD